MLARSWSSLPACQVLVAGVYFVKKFITNVIWQVSEQEELSRESLFLGVKVKGLAG